MKFSNYIASALAVLTLAACSSMEHVKDGVPQFPNAQSSWKPEGITVTRETLANVQTGIPKHQLYSLLGTPHFGEGFGGKRYWDYIVNVKDANGTVTRCNLKVQWGEGAERLHAPIEKLHWQNPQQCPPPVESKIAYRDVIKEVQVIKEVRVEVPAAKAAPAYVAAPAVAAAPVVINTQSTALEVLFVHKQSGINDLLPASKQRLDALVQSLKAGGKLESLAVTGYADRTGGESGNARLAQERADTVAMYLVQNVGRPINGAQIASRSSREAQVTCTGLEGAALIGCLQPNRRVTVETKTTGR